MSVLIKILHKKVKELNMLGSKELGTNVLKFQFVILANHD